MAKKQTRPTASWTYVLKEDEALPREQQSRFILKPLTGGERDVVRDNLARSGEGRDGNPELIRRMFQESRALCVTHIERVENFPAGEEIPWPKELEARRKYLEMLDDDQVFEVGNEIWIRSALTEDVRDANGAVTKVGEVTTVGESSPPAPTST